MFICVCSINFYLNIWQEKLQSIWCSWVSPAGTRTQDNSMFSEHSAPTLQTELNNFKGYWILWLKLHKPLQISPAHRFSDESMSCAKRGGLACFPREISAFPSKKLYVYIFTWLIFTLVSSLRMRTWWVNCSVQICFVCPVTCSVQVYCFCVGGVQIVNTY